MLNIDRIKNGIVIDHIKAGQGMKVFNWLGLDKAPYTVAFLVNAFSTKMGRKDLIKIDSIIDIDLNLLGFIDPNITVRIIKNEKASDQIQLKLPERVENVLYCNNPRCVTYTEKYIPQIFVLEDEEARTYRCEYCDDIRSAGDIKKPKS
jgi:aspartate carbamoyltransferase regulatory subunit